MYDSLLTPERIRESSRGQKPLIEEVESDRARVLYSASFRRLQRKTQVFPLEDNAAVRTRLTHSLEVAHVGRYLASSVVLEFRRKGLEKSVGLTPDLEHALAITVEVACLLHDIGNPPFGHFGEVAIARWFNQERFANPLFDDMRGFDGNPQGFRLITRLNGADGTSGMNLTLSQLAATLKYPSLPREKNALSKFGVFYSEESVLSRIRKTFRLAPEQRHPLAYLMEAADDISYCLSDIEDGAEKGIINHDEIVRLLLERATDHQVSALVEQAKATADQAAAVDKAVSFRSSLVRTLVAHAAMTYVERHDELCAGVPKELIAKESAEGRLLKLIKSVVREKVYSDRSVQSLELAGLSVITGLLTRFAKLLDISRADFKALLPKGARKDGLEEEKRLIDFIAERHVAAYLAAEEATDDQYEAWLRAHLLVDYISGMTDLFALKLHQTLEGIRL